LSALGAILVGVILTVEGVTSLASGLEGRLGQLLPQAW